MELATKALCDAMEMDEEDAEIVSKTGGFAATVGIGAAVGGPVGAMAGAAVWCAGELISSFFD